MQSLFGPFPGGNENYWKSTLQRELSDAAITAIETAADAYVEFRDERMAAMREEVDLKAKLIAVMKKNEKTMLEGRA